MNPILIDYCKRFAVENKHPQPDLSVFWTDLPLATHYQKLPYLMTIQNLCLRIYIAILKNQKVCIYSDYDTDAITATATMYHGLIDLGMSADNLEFYAPDRFTEGYGMNTDSTRELATKFDLIISVDCGINSTLEADIVRQSSNCDLIITDHHHLYSQVPDCIAVVNCRLAQVYADDIDQNFYDYKNQFEKTKAKLLLELQRLVSVDQMTRINKWLELSNRSPEEFLTKPEVFLTQSATGVGVAWFSLVWLGYFLNWVE